MNGHRVERSGEALAEAREGGDDEEHPVRVRYSSNERAERGVLLDDRPDVRATAVHVVLIVLVHVVLFVVLFVVVVVLRFRVVAAAAAEILNHDEQRVQPKQRQSARHPEQRARQRERRGGKDVRADVRRESSERPEPSH